MADEQWKKSNLVFGSAGMAASGMLPKSKGEKRPHRVIEMNLPKEPEIVQPSVIEAEQPKPISIIEEIQVETEIENEVLNFPPPALNESVSIESPEPQQASSDLKVAIVGKREVDGCNWDQLFNAIEGVVVTGEQDPHSNLVVVAERDTSRKYELIRNALAIGAHVICPAPFARSLKDADELVALADQRGLKLAVINPLRLDPNLIRFHQEMDNIIGDLVEMRIYGEMDSRSGGYDLLKHGGPLFDIMQLFAGQPIWANANSLNDGHKSSRDHIVIDEDLGPMVGDAIQAQIYTNQNIIVNFFSDRRLRETIGGWGIDFVGSKNTMRFFAGDQPTLSLCENPQKRNPAGNEQWQVWSRSSESADHLVVSDWLAAIAEDRKAQSSCESATAALEVCHAIFQSAMTNQKVYFPLTNRHHPLLPELRAEDFLQSA